MTFKIGDKVRLIKSSPWLQMPYIGTIYEIDNHHIRTLPKGVWEHEKYFVLAEPSGLAKFIKLQEEIKL